MHAKDIRIGDMFYTQAESEHVKVTCVGKIRHPEQKRYDIHVRTEDGRVFKKAPSKLRPA